MKYMDILLMLKKRILICILYSGLDLAIYKVCCKIMRVVFVG